MFQDTHAAVALGPSRRRWGSYGFALSFHGALAITLLLTAAFVVHPVQVIEPSGPIIFELEGIPPGGGSSPPSRPSAPAPAVPSIPEIREVPAPPILEQPIDTPTTIDIAPPHSGNGGDSGDDWGAPGVPGGTGNTGTATGLGMGAGGGPGTRFDSGPVELTAEMESPRLLFRVEPEYPSVARDARLSGRVILRAVVGLDGSVEQVEVVKSPNDLLTRAAESALRQWRYRPATIRGKPVRVWFTVRVDFVLR